MHEIVNERIRTLTSEQPRTGAYVIYWMQSAIRSRDNHALEYAISQANSKRLPIAVVFAVTEHYPGAQERQYQFMFEGLQAVSRRLADRSIDLQVFLGTPPQVLAQLSREAALIVLDRGYLNIHRQWYEELIRTSQCPLVQVETNTVVPVETAYHKEAYSAGVLRPKIQQVWDKFLQPVPVFAPTHKTPPDLQSLFPELTPLDPHQLPDTEYRSKRIHLAQTAMPTPQFTGGEDEADRLWDDFLEKRLHSFHSRRNDPSADGTSLLSPYLHFGMISPLRMALEARDHGSSEGVDALWEELIIRRELSCNFTHYNKHYDSPECLPGWAVETLQAHSVDKREYLYSRQEFIQAATHDPYWNAAQRQLLKTGWMHGYMRMYWGKKVLEWSASPAEAYATLMYINDTYELDGRDPNGYAGIAWCFGKHDRAWQERGVFGKVRYMNANGLKRKFNIGRYAERWNQGQLF